MFDAVPIVSDNQTRRSQLVTLVESRVDRAGVGPSRASSGRPDGRTRDFDS